MGYKFDPREYASEALGKSPGEARGVSALETWLRSGAQKPVDPAGLIRRGDLIPGVSQEMAIRDAQDAKRVADLLRESGRPVIDAQNAIDLTTILQQPMDKDTARTLEQIALALRRGGDAASVPGREGIDS